MNGFQGFLFFIILILIFILIAVLKFTYDIWATSITLKLLKNNQGNFSISRLLLWLSVILSIVFILIVMSKTQNKNRNIDNTNRNILY